jgi:hypothetical protein
VDLAEFDLIQAIEPTGEDLLIRLACFVGACAASAFSTEGPNLSDFIPVEQPELSPEDSREVMQRMLGVGNKEF